MKSLASCAWTLGFLIMLDVGIGTLTRYPDHPMDDETIGYLQRYFNYGRSIESKVRWMTADSDARAAALARSGWLTPEEGQALTPGSGASSNVAIYGMSFSARVGQAMERMAPQINVRIRGGPGAPLGRTYADYLIDRHEHNAPVVVLGILASSVPVTGTVTHMTWNFEAPSSHFYPRFLVEGSNLIQIAPPVNSLREFRAVLADPSEWSRLVQFLSHYDGYYDRFTFNADIFDHSIIARLLRRAWAQSSFSRKAAKFHTDSGFTNHDGNLDVMQAILSTFADDVRSRGGLPVVLLFNDRGYSDHLYRALRGVLEAFRIPYVSSHEVMNPMDMSQFEHDGHFLPEIDALMAERLLTLIAPHLPPLLPTVESIGDAE